MWITTRNYGFSDAAELFVFIAGYAAAVVYAKSMIAQGFAAGTSRLLERAWQLYVAHVVLFGGDHLGCASLELVVPSGRVQRGALR